MTSDRFWRGGDHVEVERAVSGGKAYFPATVVSAPSIRKKHVWVEHESLVVGGSVRMKEYVIPTHLRPSPPRELNRWFKVGDEVDVFRESEGCWVRGNVTTLLEDSRYIVEFKGENRLQTEVDHFNLRLHREWEDGVWVPSLLQQGNILESMPKLKMKSGRKYHYEKGALVEVRSEEKAYKGSWYCARILSLLGDDKYVVEHLKFKKDDGESIPLKDLVQGHNIRPVPPPEVSTVVCYEPGDEVDAWFNQRWWSGRVSKVLGRGSKYLVYFISNGEEPVVLNFNLRPRKDWINGQWVYPSKEERCKPPLKKLKSCERAEKMFNYGMMVEVRSDERGYEGSWFSAKIISYLGANRYTVEYQTLKTEDERELLKEEARGSDIRPIPPPLIQKEYRYELDEDVDAWYNEGWWSGRVCMVNNNYMRYGVYFKTTNERIEFGYNDLRPSLVWRNGKWSCAKEWEGV
ncbi:Protein AGENET DOMAIN (AGD)-CONTAINING P1 [Cardamine amara subsp. amara]|uniref:Protein AGENET DOMAIN (AGD)-CONTAINING P1 n=1 Tax=Cardamine amara subsp. amara TaxID=228776 RepID=A0ABD1AYR5_CARAN